MKVIKLRKTINLFLLLSVVSLIVFTIYNKIVNKEISISTSATNIIYKVLIDVEESKLYLFEDTKCIKIYSCSGGKWSTPSPIGTWTIIEKAKWGEGFGGSWLRT